MTYCLNQYDILQIIAILVLVLCEVVNRFIKQRKCVLCFFSNSNSVTSREFSLSVLNSHAVLCFRICESPSKPWPCKCKWQQGRRGSKFRLTPWRPATGHTTSVAVSTTSACASSPTSCHVWPLAWRGRSFMGMAVSCMGSSTPYHLPRASSRRCSAVRFVTGVVSMEVGVVTSWRSCAVLCVPWCRKNRKL